MLKARRVILRSEVFEGMEVPVLPAESLSPKSGSCVIPCSIKQVLLYFITEIIDTGCIDSVRDYDDLGAASPLFWSLLDLL